MDDLITELRLIGCHSNGDARCTCNIGQEAADEIERLRKMLADHGLRPDGEYIGPSGVRVDSPASKATPEF